MMKYGLCPKCLEYKRLTRHHILPRRIFRKQRSPPILDLCRDCHDILENKIPYKRKSKSFYFNVAKNFLQEGVNEM